MLQTMRAGQDCVLASPAIERIAHPSVNAEGRKTRPCGSAILGHGPGRRLVPDAVRACGITNKSLRALTARLLGTRYTASQMTYDLRRLRLNGLIRRIEHTHTYVLTPKARALPSSTPSSITACSDRWLQPTSRKPRPRYARH